MSISKKTILPIFFMAVLLSLSAYLIQKNVVYSAFSAIEVTYARDNIDRVIGRLEGVLSRIDDTVYDWSSWDDTYLFMQDSNEAFVESNLSLDTFWVYGTQVALFLDTSGEAVWAGVYDFEAEEGDGDVTDKHLDTLAPIVKALSKRIDLDAGVEDQQVGGIFQIGNMPVAFSMRTIHTSLGAGKSRGYVLFGQVLNGQKTEELSEQILLDFTVEPIAHGSVASGAYSIELIDEGQLIASKVLMIDGIPSLKAAVTLPRHITQLGSQITVYGTSLFVILTLFMSLTLMLLFRFLVVKPILELKNDISKISSEMDYSLRAHSKNEDEIGALSQEFNSMLCMIESNNLKLKILSETDSLTGLSNRLALDKKLSQAWNILTHTGDPLAILMIDIDHFKQYNDQYGHPAGDECLKQISKILGESAKRESDIVARYGGEEFLIVLPGTDAGAALDIASGLLEAVSSAAIEHASSKTAPVVTISIGLSAIIPSKDYTSYMLIKAADEALYRAKEGGRNAVKSSPGAGSKG